MISGVFLDIFWPTKIASRDGWMLPADSMYFICIFLTENVFVVSYEIARRFPNP